ncbi:MAG: hypothetical protein JST00_47815 [Deltaproteobacteria bacterium]|nr:hypothetical protein [Deltaproteobacteria bacterium]
MKYLNAMTITCAVALAACSRDEAAKNKPVATKPAATTVPAASAGAPGAGDRSGTSIANAKPVVPGVPTTFTLPCNASAVYVGPFSMSKDPETLVVNAEVKGTTKSQVCVVEGHWVDAKGGNPAIAGLPCVEGGVAQKTTLAYEYSPGNGGSGVNPVYWRIKLDAAKPAGCDTVEITLRTP